MRRRDAANPETPRNHRDCENNATELFPHPCRQSDDDDEEPSSLDVDDEPSSLDVDDELSSLSGSVVVVASNASLIDWLAHATVAFV